MAGVPRRGRGGRGCGAAGANAGEARYLTSEEHLVPWAGGNQNKARDDKENKLPANKGADLEEIPEFFLEPEFITQDFHINHLNGEIVKKLNALRRLRKKWLEAVEGVGEEGGAAAYHMRNIKNVKSQIGRIQKRIEDNGATYIKLPRVFHLME